jgi:hypothetical protein
LREFELAEATEKGRVLKVKAMLSRAEDIFTEYFLSKIAPSRESEGKRTEVFRRLNDLILRAIGMRKCW